MPWLCCLLSTIHKSVVGFSDLHQYQAPESPASRAAQESMALRVVMDQEE